MHCPLIVLHSRSDKLDQLRDRHDRKLPHRSFPVYAQTRLLVPYHCVNVLHVRTVS